MGREDERDGRPDDTKLRVDLYVHIHIEQLDDILKALNESTFVARLKADTAKISKASETLGEAATKLDSASPDQSATK